MVFKINRRSFLEGSAAMLATGSSRASSQEVKRIVDIGLVSDKGSKAFITEANKVGGVEAVTVYTTPGKPGLEYSNFPRGLRRVTVVMKFAPSSCGEGIYKEIIAGHCDATLIEFAQKVNADGRAIIVRPFHEFNFHVHPHSVYAFGNDPNDFIPAWRHLVELLREHTRLIEFDWNPNRESFIGPGIYPRGGATAGIAEFYPGDQWVDWVSFSTYNRGFLTRSDQRVHSFAEDLRPAYRIMDRIAGPSVRFAISETSTTSLGGVNKEAWFRALFDSIATEFTRIEIVNFFLISKVNANEAPASWALRDKVEYEMFKRLLGEFRTRMGMPAPPLFS